MRLMDAATLTSQAERDDCSAPDSEGPEKLIPPTRPPTEPVDRPKPEKPKERKTEPKYPDLG